jgi:hypothetical protein
MLLLEMELMYDFVSQLTRQLFALQVQLFFCSFPPYSKTNYMIWAPTKSDQDLSGHLHCWASQLLSLLKNSSSLDHYTSIKQRRLENKLKPS